MDIKALIIADDYNFKKAGEVLKSLSGILEDYNLKFKEVVVLPGDSNESIYKVMSYMAGGDSSAVIVCGGMEKGGGITQNTASNVFKKELVRNKDAMDLMKLVYESKGIVLSPSCEKSCYFPENSFIIPNQNTGLAGFYLTEPVFFAAIPLEPENVQSMFKNHVLGKMLGKLGITYFIKKRNYKLFGLKENEFENLIAQVKDKIKDFRYFYGFSYGETVLSVYLNGISTQKLQDNIKLVDDIINSCFKNYIYGYDCDELETVCARVLKKTKVTVSLAESITGGYISNKMTDLPGASAYFLYGGIVYATSAKIDILGVDKGIIEKYGAVSKECAISMAENVRKKASSDIGLAVTGFAGPKREEDNFPVGTVFIALAASSIKEVRKYNFPGSRTDIKTYTSKMSLFWIYRYLKDKYNYI